MNLSQIPEKPLVANVNEKVENAERVYFFERENGSIVAVQANEAWKMWNGRDRILGERHQRPKLIGSSDGTQFRQGIIEAQKIFREQGLEAAQAHMRNAEKQEIEKARGNLTPPPNMDKFGPGARFLNV